MKLLNQPVHSIKTILRSYQALLKIQYYSKNFKVLIQMIIKSLKSSSYLSQISFYLMTLTHQSSKIIKSNNTKIINFQFITVKTKKVRIVKNGCKTVGHLLVYWMKLRKKRNSIRIVNYLITCCRIPHKMHHKTIWCWGNLNHLWIAANFHIIKGLQVQCQNKSIVNHQQIIF